jgi:hypothetical protein
MNFWAPNGTRLSAQCHFTGPKDSGIPGPNPLPLALVLDMNASKTLCKGLKTQHMQNHDLQKRENLDNFSGTNRKKKIITSVLNSPEEEE